MNKYLVIGNPIEHSLSPKLHNFWIKFNNLDAIYEKKKLNENELLDLMLEVKKKNIYPKYQTKIYLLIMFTK